MATPTLGTFLRRLKQAMTAETLASCSDVELIERFRESRDEGVFQAILDRHGPMVFQVCRRVLSSQPDIEDAFQATFLILIRRGHTIRRRASLGSWLHGVAHRTSLKLRAQSDRRRRETPPRCGEPVDVNDDMSWRELRGILDEELQRLPEASRGALILCYLEGKTQDEAARQLSLSKSTLRRRLDRARDLLGKRLTRRGVALSAVLAMRLVSDSAHGSSLGRQLLTRTVESANHVATKSHAPTNVLSPQVATLTDGVVKTMHYAKYKSTALMLACCLALGVGIYQVSPRIASAEDAKPSKTSSPTAPDIEPIDANLVFDTAVQKQLRLSTNQIRQLSEAREKGTAAVADQTKRIAEIDEHLKKLHEQIEKLNQERSVAFQAIDKSQSEQVKKAITKVLSRDAVQELRQLTLQRMRLSDVLLDARMRARLELNDEQIKKIQEIAEKHVLAWTLLANDRVPERVWATSLLKPDPSDSVRVQLLTTGEVLRIDQSHGDLLKVLTPQQREALERLSGIKYEPTKGSDKK